MFYIVIEIIFNSQLYAICEFEEPHNPFEICHY